MCLYIENEALFFKKNQLSYSRSCWKSHIFVIYYIYQFMGDCIWLYSIGRQLMEALEQLARDKRYSYLILESGEPLIAAMRLYWSLGYEVIPNYGQYVNMADSVCMKKKLWFYDEATNLKGEIANWKIGLPLKKLIMTPMQSANLSIGKKRIDIRSAGLKKLF